eukprot:g18597.t1
MGKRLTNIFVFVLQLQRADILVGSVYYEKSPTEDVAERLQGLVITPPVSPPNKRRRPSEGHSSSTAPLAASPAEPPYLAAARRGATRDVVTKGGGKGGTSRHPSARTAAPASSAAASASQVEQVAHVMPPPAAPKAAARLTHSQAYPQQALQPPGGNSNTGLTKKTAQTAAREVPRGEQEEARDESMGDGEQEPPVIRPEGTSVLGGDLAMMPVSTLSPGRAELPLSKRRGPGAAARPGLAARGVPRSAFLPKEAVNRGTSGLSSSGLAPQLSTSSTAGESQRAAGGWNFGGQQPGGNGSGKFKRPLRIVPEGEANSVQRKAFVEKHLTLLKEERFGGMPAADVQEPPTVPSDSFRGSRNMPGPVHFTRTNFLMRMDRLPSESELVLPVDSPLRLSSDHQDTPGGRGLRPGTSVQSSPGTSVGTSRGNRDRVDSLDLGDLEGEPSSGDFYMRVEETPMERSRMPSVDTTASTQTSTTGEFAATGPTFNKCKLGMGEMKLSVSAVSTRTSSPCSAPAITAEDEDLLGPFAKLHENTFKSFQRMGQDRYGATGYAAIASRNDREISEQDMRNDQRHPRVGYDLVAFCRRFVVLTKVPLSAPLWQSIRNMVILLQFFHIDSAEDTASVLAYASWYYARLDALNRSDAPSPLKSPKRRQGVLMTGPAMERQREYWGASGRVGANDAEIGKLMTILFRIACQVIYDEDIPFTWWFKFVFRWIPSRAYPPTNKLFPLYPKDHLLDTEEWALRHLEFRLTHHEQFWMRYHLLLHRDPKLTPKGPLGPIGFAALERTNGSYNNSATTAGGLWGVLSSGGPAEGQKEAFNSSEVAYGTNVGSSFGGSAFIVGEEDYRRTGMSPDADYQEGDAFEVENDLGPDSYQQ